MRRNRGQTILEYIVISIVILGVMIAMKDYVKKGIQGRWKSATDSMGEQYDPQAVNADVVYGLQVNSQSIVTVENGEDNSTGTVQDGQWTNRLDLSNSVETKSGYTQVGQ